MVDTFDALRAKVADVTVDTFGASAVYTPVNSGRHFSVRAKLGTTIEEGFNDSGAYVVETREIVDLLRSEVPECKKGDEIQIMAKCYTVQKVVDARTPHKWRAVVTDV